MDTPALDRRKLLGVLAAGPIIATVPAVVAPRLTPFRIAEARRRAADRRFDDLPNDLETTNPAAWHTEVDALIRADYEAEDAPVADWQEFAAQFTIATHDGMSLLREETLHKLLADAQRLAGEA